MEGKPVIKKLGNVEGQSLIDIGILQNNLVDIAVCKFCKRGRLEFFQSVYTNGIVKHYYIICDHCRNFPDFYMLPKSSSSDIDNKIMFGHNMLQVLGGRISGIGKSGFDTINEIISLPPTLSNRAFHLDQRFLSKVSMEIAARSCKRAAEKLRTICAKSVKQFLNIPVSYDGSCQKRTGKGGGGFPRYCFAAAISIETGEVLSFEFACNGCHYCVEKQQVLKDKRLSIEGYRLWQWEHQKTCQARDYGEFKSVALESKLAPNIFGKSVDQKLFTLLLLPMVHSGIFWLFTGSRHLRTRYTP